MEYPDETDLTREDLMAMWEEGDPVEIVDSLVTIDPSPWVQEISHTSPGHHGFTRERQKSKAVVLRLSGAASGARKQLRMAAHHRQPDAKRLAGLV